MCTPLLKQCTTCKKIKPLDRFYELKNDPGQWSERCQICCAKPTVKPPKESAPPTWSKKGSIRHKARALVKKAIAQNVLHEPSRCQQCGDVAKLHAHHNDYMEPLNVRWLCVPCHRDWHRVPSDKSISWAILRRRNAKNANLPGTALKNSIEWYL